MKSVNTFINDYVDIHVTLSDFWILDYFVGIQTHCVQHKLLFNWVFIRVLQLVDWRTYICVYVIPTNKLFQDSNWFHRTKSSLPRVVIVDGHFPVILGVNCCTGTDVNEILQIVVLGVGWDSVRVRAAIASGAKVGKSCSCRQNTDWDGNWILIGFFDMMSNSILIVLLKEFKCIFWSDQEFKQA